MTTNQRVNDSVAYYEAALAAKLRAAIRYSLAQSLASYFVPPEESPPELRALLQRLDELERLDEM